MAHSRTTLPPISWQVEALQEAVLDDSFQAAGAGNDLDRIVYGWLVRYHGFVDS